MNIEEWRIIPSWPDYEVSESGQVRKIGSSVIKKPSLWLGYLRVSFTRKGSACKRSNRSVTRSIHSLVAEAFIGPRPSGTQIHHKDETKLNNHYTNIEYILIKGHRHHHHYVNPNFNKGAKLTPIKVKEIRKLSKEGVIHKELSSFYGVTIAQISYIVRRLSWKHVPEDES